MKTIKKGFIVRLLLLNIGCSMQLWAQVNISGKPGLLYIPTARVLKEGLFHFGVGYNPINYAFRFNPELDPRVFITRNSENIYFVNIAILPRVELNINLLRPNGTIKYLARGIGDRQIDLKYAILTEKKSRPALALILSAPFGTDNSLITNALVATKTIPLTRMIDVELTVGTGTPYHLAREDVGSDHNSLFAGMILSNNPKRYLAGPFGGVNVRLKQKTGVLAEWDSHHFNFGAYTTMFTHWTLQAGVLNFDQVMLGTSYAFSLFKLPKRVSKVSLE